MSMSLRTVLAEAFRALFRYTGTLVLVLLVVYLLSGFYKIGRSEVGVLTRFGKVVNSRIPPGLHYAFPYPIDIIHKVPVRQVHTMDVLDFSTRYLSGSGRGASFSDVTGLEPYAITGDDNLVAVSLSLKYVISDPVKYLFNFRQASQSVSMVAGRVLTVMIARRGIDHLLTGDRSAFKRQLKAMLQHEMDALGMGIAISLVDITELSPPPAVQPYFEKVVNVKADSMRIINEARGYEGKRLARARATADRTVRQAEARRRNRILEAQGRVERFEARLKEYMRTPDIVASSLLAEYWKRIFSSLKEVRVVTPGRGNGAYLLQFGR